MNWLSGALRLYWQLMQQAIKRFMENPIFMVIGAIIIIVLFLVQFATAGLPLFGYLIRALVQSAGYSSYLYLIYRASLGYRVDWQDAKRGIYAYTRVIMGIIILNNFIVIIFSYYLMIPTYIVLIYLLALVLLINALPEVIVNKQYYVIDSLKYTLEFEREHILLWYLPNLLFVILFTAVQSFLSASIYLFAGDFSVKMALLIIVMLLVFQLIGGVIMLFRQMLFRALDSGEYKRYFRTVK